MYQNQNNFTLYHIFMMMRLAIPFSILYIVLVQDNEVVKVIMASACIIVYISFINSMILSDQAIQNFFRLYKVFWLFLILHQYGLQYLFDSFEFIVIFYMILDFYSDF